MTSKIEWLARPGTTPESWNMIGGCSPVSAGCTNCYAARMAATRLRYHPRYVGMAEMHNGKARWTGEISLDASALNKPLSWKKSRTVFVASMSDLFHEAVPGWFIFRVLGMIAMNPQHTFMVLTKRPDRFAALLGRDEHGGKSSLAWAIEAYAEVVKPEWLVWPLQNLWLGITIESPDYRWRAEYLRQIQAAVRFISFEPLLDSFADYPGVLDDMTWVIVGGETGPGARPMHPDWARGLVQQCRTANIPVFVKQMGTIWAKQYGLEKDTRGHKIESWSKDLQVRQWPQVHNSL